MIQVCPPNKESVKATAELALDYLSQGKLDYVKIVIENVIKGLEDPDFGKPYYDREKNIVTVTSNASGACEIFEYKGDLNDQSIN
jgi:hypothetical protein